MFSIPAISECLKPSTSNSRKTSQPFVQAGNDLLQGETQRVIRRGPCGCGMSSGLLATPATPVCAACVQIQTGIDENPVDPGRQRRVALKAPDASVDFPERTPEPHLLRLKCSPSGYRRYSSCVHRAAGTGVRMPANCREAGLQRVASLRLQSPPVWGERSSLSPVQPPERSMRFPREVHSPNPACFLSTSLRRRKNDKRYRDAPAARFPGKG